MDIGSHVQMTEPVTGRITNSVGVIVVELRKNYFFVDFGPSRPIDVPSKREFGHDGSYVVAPRFVLPNPTGWCIFAENLQLAGKSKQQPSPPWWET